MRNLIFIFGLALLLGACSDNENLKEDNIEVEKLSNKLKLHLKIKDNKKDWNILELAEFKQIPNKNFSYNKIPDTYDSVEWNVIGKDVRTFNVFTQELYHTVFRWSHNFYYPGKYKLCLVGYKNNKAFSSDTITVNITNKKDFLAYNWDEIKTLEEGNIGYVNVLSEKINIATRPEIYEGTPHIVAFSWQEKPEKEKKFLEEYMTALFGKPVCDINKSKKLQEKYCNLFKYKPENSVPLAFWITSTSRIVLVKQSRKNEYYEYFVYAEPYNK